MELPLTDNTGLHLGTASGDRVGFGGVTPVAMPISSASQAAVVTTGSSNSGSPYGYTTAAQADAIVTLVNKIRADLITAGIWKGSA